MKPRMIVVAGPSGSGKSAFFPVRRLAPRGFNVDDRAAQIHGSYLAIPLKVRRQAQAECESFVLQEIKAFEDFAVETTLRSQAALLQARKAHDAGFFTWLIFVATDNVEENIARVAARGASRHLPEKPRESGLLPRDLRCDRLLRHLASVGASAPCGVATRWNHSSHGARPGLAAAALGVTVNILRAAGCATDSHSCGRSAC